MWRERTHTRRLLAWIVLLISSHTHSSFAQTMILHYASTHTHTHLSASLGSFCSLPESLSHARSHVLMHAHRRTERVGPVTRIHPHTRTWGTQSERRNPFALRPAHTCVLCALIALLRSLTRSAAPAFAHSLSVHFSSSQLFIFEQFSQRE